MVGTCVRCGFWRKWELIGSSAGVVSVGMSEKQGYPIGFNRWFKVGFPFMIITVAVATVVLSVQIILHI
jgi:Na+/H+ antiporter NhaD/arsenite permease-like protein